MTRAGQVLVLSGSVGLGHDLLAGSVTEVLTGRGAQVQQLDAMAMLGGRSARAGERVLRTLLALPGAMDALHGSGFRTGRGPTVAMDLAARGRVQPALARALAARAADLVVAVFPTGASAAAAVARAGGPPLVTVCADVTPHRLWVHEGTSAYLVTSAAAAAHVRRFQPRARVEVVSAPVRPPFRTPPTQADARVALGLPLDVPAVLLMSGGWGLGPVVEAATAIADAGVHVLAVAGRNERVRRQLIGAAGTRERLHASGFVTDVAVRMAAADLVVTSSGDTCAEARAVGRDLLLLDVVPGHGRDNLAHQLELGRAGVTSVQPALLVPAVLAALERAAPRRPVDPWPGFVAGLGAVLRDLGR